MRIGMISHIDRSMKQWVCVASLWAMSLYAAASGIIYYGPSDYKWFAEYQCSMRLPDKLTWQWGDPNTVPKASALAVCNNGMKFWLAAAKLGQDVVLNDDLIAGYEREASAKPNVRKMSGKRLIFMDVPAYELNMAQMDTGVLLCSRVFIKNQTEYRLNLLYPKNVRINRTKLELIYDAFGWMRNNEQIQEDMKAKRKELQSTYVFKENTISDNTVYSVPDARGYDCRKDGLIIRINVSGNRFVHADNDFDFLFFSIEADTESNGFNSPKGYVTNITGEIFIMAHKQTLQNAIKECKEKHERDTDVLLVKEIIQPDLQTATLLFVSDFIDGRPCTYRGEQFIQAGEYVVSIDSQCARGMAMSRNYKAVLNNILQSALASIYVNDNKVDTTVLARHLVKQ